MRHDVIVRRAEAAEALPIAAVFSESRRVALPYLPQLHTQPQVESWIKDHVLPHENVWVAEVAGGIVGFVAIAGESLNHLYIAPEFQSQGIGDRSHIRPHFPGQ